MLLPSTSSFNVDPVFTISHLSIRSRECCLPLLRHHLDSEQEARHDTDIGRLLKLLLDVTLKSRGASSVPHDGAGSADREDTAPKRGKKGSKKTPSTAPGGKGKVSAGKSASSDATSTVPMAIFPSVEAEELMHRALRTSGHAQMLALRSLASSSDATTISSAAASTSDGAAAAAAADCDGGGVTSAGADESTRQRRALILVLVEVGLTGADGCLVAAAARALPALPSDLAALLKGLAPSSSSTGDAPATPSKVRLFTLHH